MRLQSIVPKELMPFPMWEGWLRRVIDKYFIARATTPNSGDDGVSVPFEVPIELPFVDLFDVIGPFLAFVG